MSDTPDLNALARRYLDLWQDQLNRMANDPATTDMMTRTFSLMTKSAQAFAAADATSRSAAAGEAPQQGTPSSDAPCAEQQQSDAFASRPDEERPNAGRGDGRDRPTAEPDGAASATALSGDGGLGLSGLLERLAVLEARVAVLEAERGQSAPQSGFPDPSSAAKPRKPRNRKPATGV